jgi:hypothetical protein
VRKAFSGNQKIRTGRPKVVVKAGVPTEVAPVGTLCWDTTNSNAYICTVATGTWVKINA